jgi:hypothetical protein
MLYPFMCGSRSFARVAGPNIVFLLLPQACAWGYPVSHASRAVAPVVGALGGKKAALHHRRRVYIYARNALNIAKKFAVLREML